MVEYKDPLNGKTIQVRSVCMPARTLLQGKPFSMHNLLLAPVQITLPWNKR